MSEEQNTEAVQAVEAERNTVSEEAPKPRRRARKPKAEASEAPVAPAGEAEAEAPKPARRARKTAAKPSAAPSDATAAKKEPAVESDEVRQARALAQISQASVVRRQRRAAERAAEMLTAGVDEAEPKAEPKTKTEPKSEPAADAAPVDVPKATRRKAPAKKASAQEAGEAAKDATASAPAAEQPSLPLVDPALRPHRRGRKPKAYIEAEKAAAAALAAAQAASEVAAPAAPAQGEIETAPDTRPGRAARSRQDKPAEPAAEASQERSPERTAGADKQFDEAARQGSQSRRSHQNRRGDNAGGGNGQQNQPQAHGHGERNANRDFNDRRNNRQQNNRNNKRGNNRFAPAEPSLTRDELAAMKVVELREKAKEFDVDTTGKKKAELVEEVYAAAARAEGFREIEGILDITNEGFGYIRAHGYMPSRDDAFVAAQMIRAAGLRAGDYLVGTLRPARVNDKFPGLAKLRSVNGMDPEETRRRPKFADLTPIYPNEPLKMEHGKESITGRAIDIVSPIGKGQRGLIVSPPKAGKTTILKKICQSIAANNPEVHLICLLVDERPEEVTDMQRSIKGDVVASTFDMPADNHTRVSELVIERAKRIVELGGDVVVVLDSITRLARAYNLAAPASGRILSGGVDSAALYPPKRFLGAARNIENGGSLTILASALIDTGSKMDEVIFEEFKGTGNMELKLDRDLADRRIFPAIDPVASGTRNEDLLIDETMKPFVWGIRRILANMNNTERAAASFIKGLKSTNSNQEFLIRTAKKAADHEASL